MLFENASVAEIGLALGISEEAAGKRMLPCSSAGKD